MNISIVRGYLITDPDVKIIDGNEPKTIANFNLAIPNRSHKNAEGKSDVDFIRIATFGKLSDIVHMYLYKGSEVIVKGKLHSYNYKKDNQTFYGTEIIANAIEFVSKCGTQEDYSYMENMNDEELPFK